MSKNPLHSDYEYSAFSVFQQLEQARMQADGLNFDPDALSEIHPLSLLAASELKEYIQGQTGWSHNFGLPGDEDSGMVIGKMFGVLVVRNQAGELGYLSAFSGKLGGNNHHLKFVPPLFDGLAEGGFLNAGMERLSEMNREVDALKQNPTGDSMHRIRELKTKRKLYSAALQDRIFEQYHFLNRHGNEKSLKEIFFEKTGKKPPAGAGECAAPKLLQFAFRKGLEPLVLAEFWWGGSPKSIQWKHGQFYPPCQEKCGPILAYMFDSE